MSVQLFQRAFLSVGGSRDVLETNYRSTPGILHVAQLLLEAAQGLQPKRLVPSKPESAVPVHYWTMGKCCIHIHIHIHMGASEALGMRTCYNCTITQRTTFGTCTHAVYTLQKQDA